MRCYSKELDRLRMPLLARFLSPMKLGRARYLMRRAVWIGSTRALALFGVRAQVLHASRQRSWVTAIFNTALAEEILALPTTAPTSRTRLRVVHVIGSLSAGGAERQVVYLARESERRGVVEARILTTSPLVGDAVHYLPLAQNGGVTVESAGETRDASIVQLLRADPSLQRRLVALDPAYRGLVTELACEFLRLRPDVVHCWLDHTNIWGGIAAFLAGVPHIVLSTRNVNPSNFPMLDAPYFLPWYKQFAASTRVHIIGNSRVGAEDYARWIGVPAERFTVIPNGFDASAMEISSDTAREQLRRAMHLGNSRVVLGVFRIAEEKEPLDFARVAETILRANPDASVIVAGDGPMRGALEARANAIDPKRFRILGRRTDVAALLSLADVVLHTSRHEGTPNALLEAQALGCPVVATRGGGTVDAVESEGSGFLCDVGDTEALARRVLQLLDDPSLRARMSTRAKEFVRTTFSLDAMVDRSLALYPQNRAPSA